MAGKSGYLLRRNALLDQFQNYFAPDQGLCPWTPLGALPQTPVIGSRKALAITPPLS